MPMKKNLLTLFQIKSINYQVIKCLKKILSNYKKNTSD
jgi:hypothetical protein